jgi:hypothetical protein
MSTLPENELDLDKLFLPAWAQEPASAKHYAHYEGGEERSERKGDRRGRRFERREEGPGQRRREGGPRGDQRGPARRPDDRRRPFDRERPGAVRDARERREPPPPLPEVNLAFTPDEAGVESLSRQIRTTGRAYPLFDIARLILQKPERYTVTFSVKRKPEGQATQPLIVCALDETLWLSEDEAVAHVLKNHFATFYQADRTATEPPKGKYTFVAQCGLSGVILGPPNHHDYQNQLRKLHTERFSRMPFEVYKARVRIVRDEEVVKKWIDDQSWRTEYICLNMPEPLRLGNREAVEKHFRETHKDNIIKSTESHTLGGAVARSLRSPELTRLLRQTWEDQRRFPLQIATVLSQQFATEGLQFFKVNKAITHVSVARPHFLDLSTTPVSDGVKGIVEFINAHPRCSRRQLIETLAPAPPPAPIPIEPVAATAPAAAPAAAVSEPTSEQTAVIADLHWLVHQGHVIEFANGALETAKKPLPRPPKPAVKPAGQPAESTPAIEPVSTAVPDLTSEPPIDASPGSVVEPAGGAEAIPAANEPSATMEAPASTAESPGQPVAAFSAVPPPAPGSPS